MDEGLYVLERRQDGEQENDGDEVMGTPKTMASKAPQGYKGPLIQCR
jgi:hypothetical protein